MLACTLAVSYHKDMLNKCGKHVKDIHGMELERAKAMLDKATRSMDKGIVLDSDGIDLVESWLDSGYRMP